MGWAVSTQKKKRSRSARRDSSDEELCEESKSQRMDKKRTPKKSPEKSKNVFTSLVGALKEGGELTEKRADEYSKLLQLSNKQGALYKEMEEGLRAGDEIDMARLKVLSKMYDKVGNRCYKRLNNLADTECKAIMYDGSSSSSSSPDTTVEDEDNKAGI